MPIRESEDVGASPGESTLPGEVSPQVEPPSPLPAPESLPGGHWAHYELLELLGRGGMGEVYRARDWRLGRLVALKFLRGADPDHAMRFLQEARAQARIDHPHVCKVYEVGEVHGKAYIAMQLLAGQRLDQAAPGLSSHEKVQVVMQLAEAMHAAHKLGVIHRDLKPSNIMVEREDGRCIPVVMDFGLAYDMGQGHGLTQTGALMGTPAYMAPEQARGDVRGIDRRADVYSLGATLYELLTGRVPFLAPSLAATLQLVLHAEPPPPRTLASHVPEDLETIVLKCLSKEPGQRYDSARALAEDLGRYIDGEPIVGQRPSLLSRLRRSARKHRTLVVISGGSLVGMLLLALFGTRSWLEARSTRRQSEARSRLAGQLGQEVNEVEWLLRSTALLPLHDTTPEQRLVRQRMARMATRKPDLGAYGEGLVHYALGRGHLALGELDLAYQELTRARELGIDSPELHYALGRVLGELYQRAEEELYRRALMYPPALKAAGGGGRQEWMAEQQQRLEKQYLEPALQSLERSRGLAEWESSRYLEGLIAFHRKQYDLASQLAARAMEEAPWLYEARQLQGDVAYAQAMELLEQGEYGLASTRFEAATTLFARAAEAWRSDAHTYEELSRAWWQRSELEFREGHSRKASLERALAASQQGLQAAPQRAAGYTLRAQLLMNWYRLMRYQGGGSPPGPILDEWTDTAKRAVTLDPRDVYAYDTLGYSQYMRGSQQALDGVDPNGSWSEAIGWFNRALEVQPGSAWSHNDLAITYRWKGGYQQAHGEDPRESFAQAEHHLQLAARSDPKYLFAYTNLVDLYDVMAASEVTYGRSPQSLLERARQAGQQALALDEHFFQTLTHLALAELTSARFHLDSGEDPRPDLERARPLLERSVTINATAPQTWLAWAQFHLVEVEEALREGRNPGSALDAGHRALAETVRLSPKMIDRQLVSVEMDLAEAEEARREGRPGRPLLRRALDEARRAVGQLSHVDTHLELARALGQWAEVSSADEASTAITEGLEQVARALALDPTRARAQALRGRLLLARARMMRQAPARLDAVREAEAVLARALELNPLLEREYAASLQEARSLRPPTERNGSSRP